MKITNVLYWFIVLIFFTGIYGASGLVISELDTGDGCPKIGLVPACVIILICLILPLISHIVKKWNVIYFFFTGVAFLIALYATIMQVGGSVECPKTTAGTPMCYLSLLIFSTLIIFKSIEINYVNKNNN